MNKEKKYLLRLLLGFAMLLLNNEITADNISFISEVAGFTGTPDYTLLTFLARIIRIISISGTFVIIVNIYKLFMITYKSDLNK